jgi:predicted nucleic acid-binding protein
MLRLVTGEADSPQAIAEYRRLGSPRLFFLALHALEVRNAILQRAFHQRRSVSSGERRRVARERDTARARLDSLVARGALLDVTVDWEAAMMRAANLSTAHTERLGARAIDLLHIAAAITLESDVFFTTDTRQAQLAKAAGLKVVSVG